VFLLFGSWILPIAALALYYYFGAWLDTSGLGTPLRVATVGLGSVLAMLAFRRFLQAETKAF